MLLKLKRYKSEVTLKYLLDQQNRFILLKNCEFDKTNEDIRASIEIISSVKVCLCLVSSRWRHWSSTVWAVGHEHKRHDDKLLFHKEKSSWRSHERTDQQQQLHMEYSTYRKSVEEFSKGIITEESHLINYSIKKINIYQNRNWTEWKSIN